MVKESPRPICSSSRNDWLGNGIGARWHVYPEQAAVGLRTTRIGLAKFPIEVQRTNAGQSSPVPTRATMQENAGISDMVAAIGDFAFCQTRIVLKGMTWW